MSPVTGWWTGSTNDLSAATVARRELLAELPHVPAPDTFEPMVWHRGTEVRARRLRPERNPADRPPPA